MLRCAFPFFGSPLRERLPFFDDRPVPPPFLFSLSLSWKGATLLPLLFFSQPLSPSFPGPAPEAGFLFRSEGSSFPFCSAKVWSSVFPFPLKNPRSSFSFFFSTAPSLERSQHRFFPRIGFPVTAGTRRSLLFLSC